MGTQVLEKIIYECRKSKPERRKRRPGAAACVFKVDGKWHTFVNCAIPLIPPNADGSEASSLVDSICLKCGYGYADLMSQRRRQPCIDCTTEHLVEWGHWVQETYDVDLGWGSIELDRKWELLGDFEKHRITHKRKRP